MSFLDQLKTRKCKLKATETVVTTADGQRYVEGKSDIKLASTHGFVVDTKPDNVPALLTDHLYIGSQDCAVDDVLKAYNIKHVLSLGVNVDIVNIDQEYIECLDLPETDIKPVISAGLRYIRTGIESGDNVLVHCNAGVSRASMIVIAYLMHYMNMNFDAAYSFVKEKRPAIQPNEGFKKQLIKMEPGRLF